MSGRFVILCTKCGARLGDLPTKRKGFIHGLLEGGYWLVLVLAHVQESTVGCRPLDMVHICPHGEKYQTCSRCFGPKVIALGPIPEPEGDVK